MLTVANDDVQSGQVISDFFNKYTKLHYKKGEVILRASDPPPGALYLKSGLVRMSFMTDAGDMLVLHVFRPGSVFPMPWIINNTPNRYSFETLLEAEVWRAPKEDLLGLFADTHKTQQYMMSRMLSGLTGLMRRMEFLVFDSAYKKTVLLLLYYVKNFSEENEKGKLRISLTHREIAAWIGTTRETASLQVELLKRKKLLIYNRRSIYVPNVQLLESEVDQLKDVA